ncbi:MAG: hypothetical protein PHO10_04090 [Gemmiger sp.]|nr:hypothetical protein [Gemmiger sp.]
MKQFFARLLLFLALLAAGCAGVLYLSSTNLLRGFFTDITDSGAYSYASSDSILPYITQVQTPDATTKLVVGDSVCWQVFDPLKACNPVYSIAGTNRAVTMAGQYLLAAAYLESHPAATEIYLVVGFEAFSSGFDATYGYQYAVLPFAQAGLLGGLDATTQAELKDAYGSFFLHPGVVRWLDRSPLAKKLYLNFLAARLPQGSAEPVNALSVRCLQRLYDLCAAKGVALHLLSPPVADSPERRQTAATLQASFEKTGMAALFPEYFADIPYYPAEEFRDGTHLADAFSNMAHLTVILDKMKADTGLLGDFVTSYG